MAYITECTITLCVADACPQDAADRSPSIVHIQHPYVRHENYLPIVQHATTEQWQMTEINNSFDYPVIFSAHYSLFRCDSLIHIQIAQKLDGWMTQNDIITQSNDS